ncbi:LysR family transcriptional regulator [Rhizobium sp. 18065]|uniref:LysR family transcriptional regulator n=1 Tax=Rhizobium sp. 18065 TaxID=2681411 RepID=UPI001357D8AA|nr:LysR family transcriptional regulator [Rhizobium sp. 18065]
MSTIASEPNMTGDNTPLPNLRHLRAVEAVGRHASIGKAALELRLSQPAVTQAVAKVEASLGRNLFERHQKGTYLARAGEVYLNRVRRFIDQCDAAFISVTNGEPGRARYLTSVQVRGLIAISVSTTFSQAAHISGISTSSLHRTVRDLEALVGQPLYTSSPAGLRMTDTGANLARKLALALREMDAALDEISSLDGLEEGKVLIGALPMSGAYLIGAAIARLTERFPKARVVVTNAPYGILFNSLRNGGIDMIFGVLRRPDWEMEITEVPLFTDPYCIVARSGHPLARRSEITQSDLLSHDWIAPGQGTPRRREYDALFEGQNRQPNMLIETSSMSTIRAILACSNRLALVSRHEIEMDEQLDLLAVLPWAPSFPPATKGISIRSNWLPTPIQRQFVSILKESVQALDKDP